MTGEEAPRGSPYQGLAPYDETDAAFFFGRERERDLIVANLMASRLTILYGVSGVGKSSVLRAGVAHHLHALAHQNRREFGRPLLSLAVFNGWSAWRGDLSGGVVHAVRAAVGEALGGDAPAEGDQRLLPTLEAAARAVDGDVMLVLDQFEEYFVYRPDDTGANSFAAEFVAMVNATSLPVSVLVSIREDSIGQLRVFKGRVPHLLDATLHVDHLSPEAAREAIVEPVRQYNKLYGTSVEIEPELVDEVLADLLEGANGGGSNGRDEIETPYLQLVMTSLWDEEQHLGSDTLRVETLKRLGQGKAILRKHLATRMKELTSREQGIAARFFYHLVTPSGTKIGHAVADLSEFSNVPVKGLRPVLERLAQPGTWILRASAPAPGQGGGTRYEIFHDLLALPILEWRARYRTERDRRRFRRGAAVFAALVLIALATIGVAVVQTRAAGEGGDDDKNLLASLGAEGTVNRAEFSRDGQKAVGAIDDHTAVIWSTNSKSAPAELDGHSGPVRTAVFGAEDTRVVTASVDGTARTWDASSGTRLEVLRSNGPVNAAAFSPAGKLVVTASDDGTARIWTATGNEKFRLRHRGTVNSATFDGTGERVLTTASDGSVVVWSVASGQQVASLRGHDGPVLRASFSPDGESVITAGVDGTARVWRYETGDVVVLRGHEGAVTSASFNNRDPTIVLTGSDDRTARVWNARTGRTLRVLRGHVGAINRAVFGQRGNIVATASDDGTARIWTLDGKERQVLSGHAGPVLSISLDGDGYRALTAGSDGTARLYKIACLPKDRPAC